MLLTGNKKMEIQEEYIQRFHFILFLRQGGNKPIYQIQITPYPASQLIALPPLSLIVSIIHVLEFQPVYTSVIVSFGDFFRNILHPSKYFFAILPSYLSSPCCSSDTQP